MDGMGLNYLNQRKQLTADDFTENQPFDPKLKHLLLRVTVHQFAYFSEKQNSNGKKTTTRKMSVIFSLYQQDVDSGEDESRSWWWQLDGVASRYSKPQSTPRSFCSQAGLTILAVERALIPSLTTLGMMAFKGFQWGWYHRLTKNWTYSFNTHTHTVSWCILHIDLRLYTIVFKTGYKCNQLDLFVE